MAGPGMSQIFRVSGFGLLLSASWAIQVGAAPPGSLPSSVVPAVTTPSRTDEVDGAMLDSIERVRQVSRQALTADVRAALTKARERMVADPVGSSRALATVRQRVRTAPEIAPAERDQLLAQIDTVQRQAESASRASDHRAIDQDQAQRMRAARQELNQALVINQQAAARHVARVNELAAGQQYRQAEAEARLAGERTPAAAASTALALESRTRLHITEAQSLAERRRQKLYEEFRTEDRQQAVISDDPPIVYPSAAKWQSLSERRKKWGETASTYRPGPGEEKINKALRETTSIDFQNMPLADAIDYLKDKHGIEIQLDNKNLSLVAISSAVPVTCKARGITLASALRLVLNDLDLSWIVHNDVLLITTKEQADSVMSTRIYPVGDLVIPVQNPFGLPGGMPF
jgi:hypothetical protein